jgi:hypothetical protein
MPYPLLYEINTRCWLRDLSLKQGRAITLAEVPAAEIESWRELGFTHIWLMGVWTSGPRSRARALTDPLLRAAFSQILPDWQETDVAGSPYAIAEYEVLAELGGDDGLQEFRKRIGKAGMKLVLDFVPNHVGLDNPWVWERPELFVQSATSAPETFRQSTAGGTVWLAHGKDPNFPAWSDTVQLDYRRASTRAAMSGLLQKIAGQCDGVRCDMAMLILNEIFHKTWNGFPINDPPPTDEFWAMAIATTKQAQHDFIFIAEAYWGLESRLQTLGFDYTYDKALYDKLLARQSGVAQRYIVDSPKDALAAGTHFLENHDEPRIASLMSQPEHRAAALMILGLPGMRFLHEGQLSGARVKVPVQLARRPSEPVNSEIQKTYRELMASLRTSAVGQGSCEILAPRPAWPGNPTAQNFVLVQWQSQEPSFDLVVVNLAPNRSQCYAPVQLPKTGAANWRLKDLLGREEYVRYAGDLQAHGLYLDLPAYGAQIFQFDPALPGAGK